MFWLFIIVTALLVTFWLRAVRRARETWLRSLNLIGRWELAAQRPDGEPRSLTLSGDLAAGNYMARDGDATAHGTWRLSGHTLTLEPSGGAPEQYELRLFEAGRIGLDGPGRRRELYVKRDSNVIPLRARP